MSGERCERCDKVPATQEDHDDPSHPGGCTCDECCSKCWGNGVDCSPIDWRERALAAERERDEARVSLSSVTEALDGMHANHRSQRAEIERLRVDLQCERIRSEDRGVSCQEAIRDRDEAREHHARVVKERALANQRLLAAEQERDLMRVVCAAAEIYLPGEGCITEPACGACRYCDLYRAVVEWRRTRQSKEPTP